MKFTTKSKQLIDFIKETNFVSNIKHNKTTSNIFLHLYQKIFEAYQFLLKRKQQEPTYHLTTIKINNASQIIKPRKMNYSWIPIEIIKHIETHISIELSYSFSLFERKIKLYFMDEFPRNINQYQKIIDLIIMWLYIVHSVSTNPCANTLVIYCYFTSLEKTLPYSNSEILNQNHVNTAFTVACQSDTEIVLFRKEEWFKVLIHESFHTFGLDFSDMNNDKCKNRILKTFKVISDVNLFEAYTEFWAETLNACFCSFIHLKEKENTKEFLFLLENYINIERKYSYFQLVKTLDFMGLTYKNLYSEDKNHQFMRDKLYKEKTNVLSYYVIKSVLMSNYENFLIWCMTNNISLLMFKKTHKNLMEFCSFIENHYKNHRMITDIQRTEHFFHENKQNKTFLFKNMRMSICELDTH